MEVYPVLVICDDHLIRAVKDHAFAAYLFGLGIALALGDVIESKHHVL